MHLTQIASPLKTGYLNVDLGLDQYIYRLQASAEVKYLFKTAILH